jgi:hypothetical protein
MIKISWLLEVNTPSISPSPSLRIVADEEDVFESDFESTDEEAEAVLQTADAGERRVKAEERKEKKVDFQKVFPVIDLPSDAGCAEPGRKSCCSCARPSKGHI